MAPNVPTSDSGTATLGMMVAAMVRRKRKITITTRAMTSISSNSTSCTEARMVVVRSVRVVTWIEVGSEARSCGSSVVTRSTTEMMLAPGWRWMLTITAGTWFIQAASRRFSVESVMLAMSDRRTGLPLR
jgi:hypothetical protein